MYFIYKKTTLLFPGAYQRYIVLSVFSLKVHTTTINLTNQKAEIINPSLSMLYNNPLKTRCQLLQVCQSVLFPNRYSHIVSVQVLLLTYYKSFPILPLSKSKVPSIERNGKPYDLTYFVIGVAILLGVLLIIYWTGYRGLPQDDFNPVVLWIDHNSNLVPSN